MIQEKILFIYVKVVITFGMTIFLNQFEVYNILQDVVCEKMMQNLKDVILDTSGYLYIGVVQIIPKCKWWSNL